jgi:hypothetical protein
MFTSTHYLSHVLSEINPVHALLSKVFLRSIFMLSFDILVRSSLISFDITITTCMHV